MAISLRSGHEPLGRLVAATSYDTGRTKTEITQRVPVHAILAKLLAAWKLSDWECIYGRVPTSDDLIAPTRNWRNVATPPGIRIRFGVTREVNQLADLQ